jgi:hypothetical protein
MGNEESKRIKRICEQKAAAELQPVTAVKCKKKQTIRTATQSYLLPIVTHYLAAEKLGFPII